MGTDGGNDTIENVGILENIIMGIAQYQLPKS